MTPTPIALLQQAADCGLKLGFEPPDTLSVDPARLCLPKFAATLKAHKPALLALLKLPSVPVFSQILGETLFFCEDEETKAALIEAGAEAFSVYTRTELRILWEANRVAPFTVDELKQLHQLKRTFNARI